MRTLRALLLVLVVLAGCSQPEPLAVPDPPVPTFTADPELAPEADVTVAPPTDPDGGASPAPANAADAEPTPRAPAAPPTTASPTAATATPTAAARPPEGTITDEAGDVRAGTPLQDPPPHLDLRAVTLRRHADGYEVRVRFAGPAPDRREGSRVTNVATFFDVDGDAELDYQVYATSTPEGWGSAYYDHTAGEARYADDDEVEVAVADGDLVIRFPLGHLGGAARLQWSAATQWGTFEELHAGTDARDRAPDDGHGVRWPAQP